jgi:CHAT domain-containing protein
VEQEVRRLAALLPGARVLLGADASLAAMKAAAREGSLLHFATHAYHRADNPLFSGLRCADDWLLARDLYELSAPCDLATLSACHTAAAHVEPGDELFGLLRGFLAAGARSVAASLWSVDDAATCELMTRFYTALQRGAPTGAALRAAQRAMLADYPHPYYWAAFLLVGDRGSRTAGPPGKEPTA